MVALPLAHISWAVADNATRKACDAFFLDALGAETAFEMLMTPEMAKAGFDREERLMVIGDTMLIPIAPAGPGEDPNSSTGNMLRRNAGPNRWLGVALRVADLPSTDAWFRAKGFTLHYDPGMESHYFLIGRGQALGVRLELMVGELPNDPRLKADWRPERWRDDHPLGIEGLQSIGVSVPDLDSARVLFEERLEWPEIGARRLGSDDADCASFLMGDTVIEAMRPTSGDGPLARHVQDVKGIYCLTFKVRSADAAANYLREKGLEVIGDVRNRFAIAPEQAFERLIYFTEQDVPGYPPLGSMLKEPAKFPVAAEQA
jgi:catechol 2,3-dioxygenase-like lactoylglutathione lyase family enzyme